MQIRGVHLPGLGGMWWPKKSRVSTETTRLCRDRDKWAWESGKVTIPPPFPGKHVFLVRGEFYFFLSLSFEQLSLATKVCDKWKLGNRGGLKVAARLPLTSSQSFSMTFEPRNLTVISPRTMEGGKEGVEKCMNKLNTIPLHVLLRLKLRRPY